MRVCTTCAVLIGLLVTMSAANAQTSHPEEKHFGPGILGKIHEGAVAIERGHAPLPPSRAEASRGGADTGVEIIDLEALNVEVSAISDDGEIIVGRRLLHFDFPELEGSLIRWAPWTGPMEIGGTSEGSGVPVVSGPGDVIFGTLQPDPEDPWTFLAARWVPSTFGWDEWDPLYDLDHVPPPPPNWSTETTGLSQNGLHLVGMHYESGIWAPKPFHWTEQDGQGWVALPLLDEGAAWIVPRAVSNDGRIIAGGHSRLPTGQIFGVRWVDGEPDWILGEEGEYVGEVLACNSDCSVMAGNSVGNSETESVLAYRWTEEGGVQYLEPFEGAPEASRYWASDVSEDGSVIVGGYAYRVRVDNWEVTYIDGFIWFDDGAGGTMHHLPTWLGYHGIDFFSDWFTVSPQAITPDGRFIAGSGEVLSGDTLTLQSWRLELPQNESHCFISSSLAFENVVVGVPSTLEAVVTNAGTGTCELTGAHVSDDAFSIAFTPTTLVAGGQARFAVTFSAEDLESYQGELTFESPEGDFSGTLTATALTPPIAHLDASELSFTLEGGEQTQAVVLQNQGLFGSAHLEYAVTGISSDDSDLEAVSVAPMEGSVGPASWTELSVTVDPTGLSGGTHTYVVTLDTNDPEAPELTLAVVIAATTSAEGGSEPVAFDLLPAYPNPFEGATTIAFDLPQAQHVVIEVLDLAGRRVAVLIDEALPGGRHEVRWDAAGLASGTYLYRMRAGAFTRTLRATLVR